jgi:hypothetical protein
MLEAYTDVSQVSTTRAEACGRSRMLCSNGISMNDEQMMTEHMEWMEQGIMGNGYTGNISLGRREKRVKD